MNENEKILVTEQVTENVEQTTEETPKTYTEAEFNAKLDEVLGKKLARREAKIRKEYDRKYGGLVDTLKAGTGKESVDELNDAFTKFYESKGIKINKKPEYTDRDIETLARTDAEEIIRSEEAVEEFERLEKLGAKMNAREQATFKLLAEHLQDTERSRELKSIGVPEDVYNSKEFKDFQKMFTKDTPVQKVYETYNKTLPKKEFKTMGSMKNPATDKGVKEYYSYEEAQKFTTKDFDKNPELYEAVRRSMLKW